MCLKHTFATSAISVKLPNRNNAQQWLVGEKIVFWLPSEERKKRKNYPNLKAFSKCFFRYEFTVHSLGFVTKKCKCQQDVECEVIEVSRPWDVLAMRTTTASYGYHIYPWNKNSAVSLSWVYGGQLIHIPVICDPNWLEACSAKEMVVERFVVPSPCILESFLNANQLQMYQKIHDLPVS